MNTFIAIHPRITFYKALIIYFIALSVFIDLVNGYMLLLGSPSLIGVMHKTSVILLSTMLALLYKPLKFIIVISLIVIVLFGFILLYSIKDGGSVILDDLKVYIRIVYPVFITLALTTLLKNHEELLSTFLKSIYYYGFVAAVAILLNVVTGFGTQTYGDYAFGYQSYFYAANEIGLSLVIISAFTLAQSLKNGVIKFRLLFLATFMGGCTFFIGSITSMAGIFLSFMVILCIAMITIKSNSFSFIWLKRLGVILLISICTISYYAVSTIIKQYPYVAAKIERVITGEGSRDMLADAANEYIAEKDAYDLLVGVGYTQHTEDYANYYSKKKEGVAIVERDPYDVIGAFGLVLGSLILVVYYLVPVLIILYSRLKLSFEVLICIYLLMLVVGHSYYAGHVIFSPMVNTFYFLIAIHAYINIRNQRCSDCFSKT